MEQEASLMALNSYQDLKVWQKSRLLVKDVYLLCDNLPKEEMYGLSSQMKRSSVSVPSNIAEGYRRNNRGEYLHFLGIAPGSVAKLETQLTLTQDLFGKDTAELLRTVDEIQRMLIVLRRKLNPSP